MNISHRLPRITFLLPGRNRSGGVRVTARMADELIGRGHRVRIAYRRTPRGFRYLPLKLRDICRQRRNDPTDWLGHTRAEVIGSYDLRQIDYHEDEIVIGVGTLVFDDLRSLRLRGLCVARYCHGFSEHLGERGKAAWRGPIPTIAVSETLVPQLTELSGRHPIAVIPNAIEHDDYHVLSDVRRDGVGTIFSRNPKKDPDTTLAFIQQWVMHYPDIPVRVFGTEPRPTAIKEAKYTRCPTIAQARLIYNQSKVWVVASRSEGFCLPILEAMACGCAVVSTNHDTAPGLIENGRNGVLVPIGDAGALVNATARLFDDDGGRNSLISASSTTVKRFSWFESGRIMEETLHRLLTAHKSGQVA